MDTAAQVDIWRQKSLAGEMTIEEYREAIAYLRSQRQTATVNAKAKGTSKKVINSDQLLDELDNL